MNLSLRSMTVGVLALGASVLAPQAAPAAVQCTHSANKVTVELQAANDHATIAASAGGGIAVGGVICGGASVYNTDVISVSDVSGGPTEVQLDGSQAGFVPGAADEGFGSEIDIELELGSGTDTLIVDAHKAGGSIVAGTQGVNLNTLADGFAQDSDVSLSGVDRLIVNGSEAADWIGGQGGGGTGAPFAQGLWLHGRGGDDHLDGSGVSGWPSGLFGDAGDDTLAAGANADYMEGGPGDDSLTGGPARDEVGYAKAPAGVTVDLAITGPQDTGGAGVDTISGTEALSGSAHRDVLAGDGGMNLLVGREGDDVLDGRAGDDALVGGLGSDLLRGGSGAAQLFGDDGEDTVAYDDAPGPVTIDLGLPGVFQDTGAGKQELTSVEGVIGSPFADRLTGSAGPDAIDGGAGADTVDGGEGADRLGGGPGIDTIDSRDASADSVSCGEGPDSLALDALDTVAPDCAPPASGGPAGAGTGGTAPASGSDPRPVLGLSVPRQSLHSVLARGLRVVLTCSTACRAGGRLVVARATARRLGLRPGAASRRLGRLAPVDLAAGGRRAVRVRLSRQARAALRRTRAVRLVLRAHAVDAAGNAAAPVRRAVRLRAR